MKIAITGGTGLVGSRVIELLQDKYEFVLLNRDKGFDITNPTTLVPLLDDNSISILLHLAAFTDVDGAEREKDWKEDSAAWKMNVTGTQNIVDACKVTSRKIIYVSTEFVFDGKKGNYTEEDTPSPINWYGQTKYEGEKVIQNSGLPYVIARLSSPYRAEFETKKDFMRAMKARLENNQEINGVKDHTFTPTFIDDFAHALEILISKNAEGIFHVVGSDSMSPYDAALKIADAFNLDKNIIKPTTREDYFKGKAERGLDWSVKNGKIKALGIEMRTFEEGLEEIKK